MTFSRKFSASLGGAVLAFSLMAMPAAADVLRQITVQGQGVVTAAPDMATIQLGVRQRAKDPATAMQMGADAAQKVIARLKAMGIAASDLQTSNLSLHTVDRYGPDNQRYIDGYEVANTLTVHIRDLEELGPVLSAVVQDGANHFHGLQFAMSEPRPAVDEARRAAVKDALAKAALYADAAGVELGQVLSIATTGASAAPMPMMRAEMKVMADMPVEAGEVQMSETVTLVIELQ